MSEKSKFVTRKEIGAALEMSDDTVARREREFGLTRHRDPICRKPIRYRRAAARRELHDRGHEVTF